jgi:hypothetical protein
VSIHGSDRLSNYHDNTAPGARQKSLGIVVLLLSAVFAYYLFREKAIESWMPIDAKVFSTSIQETYHRRRGSTYRANVQARYHVGGGAYTYACPYGDEFYSGRAAERYAKSLIDTPIVVRYDPGSPEKCLAEQDVAFNRSVAPWVSILPFAAGAVGFMLLLSGFAAGGSAPALNQELPVNRF